VFDASGKAHAAGDLALELDAGGASKLKFEWDAPSLSYRAKVSGDLDLNAKSIVLSVSADAKLGAVANADLKVKVPEVSVQVNATKTAVAKATASIRAPSVNVDIKKTANVGPSPSGSATAKAKAGFSLGTK